MKKLLVAFVLIILFFDVYSQDYEPIPAKRIVEADTFHQKYIIKDPYRWMETDPYDMLEDWVDDQNKQAEKYLKKVARKIKSENPIKSYNVSKRKCGYKPQEYYFKYGYYHRAGLPALFYRHKSDKNYSLIVNFNKMFSRKHKSLKGYSVSPDNKYLVYQYGTDGTDWAEAKVVVLETNTHLKDHLENLKFSPIVWMDDGFLYTVYHQDDKYGKTKRPQLYYHKIGTKQEEDKLLFERKNNPYVQFSFQSLSNNRYIILSENDEQKGIYNYFYIDTESNIDVFRPLLMNLTEPLNFAGIHNEHFIIVSYRNNNTGNIVSIDPKNPYQWNEIMPAYPDAVVLRVVPLKDKLLSIYRAGNHPLMMISDYKGKILYKIDLPIASSVTNLLTKYKEEPLLYFMVEGHTLPAIGYKLNLNTFDRELTSKTKIGFDHDSISYEEVYCPGNDSVDVPITLVYQRDLQDGEPSPLLLKTYGGFGSIASPSFDPGLVHFIKKGGIFAYAKIRGGGDRGRQWHLGGSGDNKSKSISDFINAASYLIDEGYTIPEKLAAAGASNGGLVVASAIVQRPGLFNVAVIGAAPLDILRMEEYTVGVYHRDEYGTVEDSTSFLNMKAYSPYHNIDESKSYPNILLITGENDDRVPPFHSYKFTAKLQEVENQKNPVLLRVLERSGHYGSAKMNTAYESYVHQMDFILYHLMQGK